MASTIRIKRSSVSGNPATLAAGELAYSALTDNGSNGGDRLYIGMGAETAGNAASHIVIGGKYFTDKLDQTPGVLTANKAIVVDSNKKIDQFLVDNLDLNGNTISSTDTNGNITLDPNGTGYVQIVGTNGVVIPVGTTSQRAPSVQGAIRFNTDSSTFEGYSGTNWGSLGGVKSVDGYTYIISESTPGASDGILHFYAENSAGNGSVEAAQLDRTKLRLLQTTASTSSTTGALVVDGGAGIAGAVYVGGALNVTGNATLNANVTLVGSDTAATEYFKIQNASAVDKFIVDSATGATTISGLLNANGNIASTSALTISSGGSNTNVVLAPQGTGTVDVSGKRITSVAEPTQATDAATKSYVDAVKTGLDIKDSVRAATTTNLSANYSNGASGVGATLTGNAALAPFAVDGVTLAQGDRVLIKDQTASYQNGIYTVTDTGSYMSYWVLTRAVDTDSNTPVVEVGPGMFTFVEEGNIAADSGFVCTTNGAITIGSTAITWAQFSGAGQVVAGAGLTKTGNTVDVVGTTNRITVNADSIDIASTYVGQTSITTLGTITAGTWNGNIISGTYGGTGVNNGANTITLGGNLVTSGAFSTTFTTTATTNVTLPTTGTLATLTGTESLSNKTITSSSFSGTTISASGLIGFTNTTEASAIGTAAVVLSGGLSVAKKIYAGSDIVGTGTSLLDQFVVDGGIY